MNDEILEGYFMLFGKHKDRVIIEISLLEVPLCESTMGYLVCCRLRYRLLWFWGVFRWV